MVLDQQHKEVTSSNGNKETFYYNQVIEFIAEAIQAEPDTAVKESRGGYSRQQWHYKNSSKRNDVKFHKQLNLWLWRNTSTDLSLLEALMNKWYW